MQICLVTPSDKNKSHKRWENPRRQMKRVCFHRSLIKAAALFADCRCCLRLGLVHTFFDAAQISIIDLSHTRCGIHLKQNGQNCLRSMHEYVTNPPSQKSAARTKHPSCFGKFRKRAVNVDASAIKNAYSAKSCVPVTNSTNDCKYFICSLCFSSKMKMLIFKG